MNLPEDIIYYIVNFLEKQELLKLNITSKNIYKYTNQNKFWYNFYKKTFNQYIFETNKQKWKKNFISISKLSKIYFKIIKKIGTDSFENTNNEIIYSNSKDIYWINYLKDDVNQLKKNKIKVVVHNNFKYGYCIITTYIINYDQLYFSVYFVKNSQTYSIFYRLDF